jgi:hypothetical protein
LGLIWGIVAAAGFLLAIRMDGIGDVAARVGDDRRARLPLTIISTWSSLDAPQRIDALVCLGRRSLAPGGAGLGDRARRGAP